MIIRLSWIGDPGKEHITLTTNGIAQHATSFVLTGDVAISSAQSSLRGATYINTAEEPSISNRSIEVSLYSGDGTLLSREYRGIWIRYINDHAPDGLTRYDFSVPEELEINSIAAQIIPVDNDKDINPSFTFSISGSVSIPFLLNGTTGELIVISRISFELMASYQFEVSD